MSTNEKLYVIEGLDGSGKSTQFEGLLEYYKSQNHPVKGISFPDYAQESSALVRMYLGGEFGGSPDCVNAYAASAFYAVDRYASFKQFWEQDYINGTAVIAARYTTSNAIYQLSKLEKQQWDGYLDWLYDFEFDKLRLPRPDKVLFLDMPPEISQRLLLERYGGNAEKHDLHERDLDYLTKCRQAAVYVAERLNWVVIPCAQNGRPLSVEAVRAALIKELDI